MDDPIYLWQRARPRREDDGTVEVSASRPGPAGLSSVELADGSVWSVDHARPDRLVSLEVADLLTSPLAHAAFGGEGVMCLVDRMKQGDRVVRRAGFRSGPLDDAALAGRAVVLADLAADEDLGPLARLAAAAELVRSARFVPGGELLADVADRLLVDLLPAAGDIDDLEVALLDPGTAQELADLLSDAPSDPSSPVSGAPGLRSLAERLRRAAGDAADLDHDLDLLAAASPLPAAGPPPEELLVTRRLAPLPEAATVSDGPFPPTVERVTPSLLEVRAVAPAGMGEPWVRVLRRRGLVALAQAPLRDGPGPWLVGRVAVPPDVADDDLVVEVLDASELDRPERPEGADAVRRAVRLGREAARADRMGRPDLAVGRWRDCAEAWAEAGDDRRAETAEEFAVRPRARAAGRAGPTLSDRVVEAHDDW